MYLARQHLELCSELLLLTALPCLDFTCVLVSGMPPEALSTRYIDLMLVLYLLDRSDFLTILLEYPLSLPRQIERFGTTLEHGGPIAYIPT